MLKLLIGKEGAKRPAFMNQNKLEKSLKCLNILYFVFDLKQFLLTVHIS